MTDDEFLNASRDADVSRVVVLHLNILIRYFPKQVLIYTGQNYWSADDWGVPPIRVGASNKSSVLDQIQAVRGVRACRSMAQFRKAKSFA